MTRSIENLLRETRRPRILVVGDVMLDRYVWGNVERISPEAPIPVLNVMKTEDRVGGAGSVTTMLNALEVEATLVSAVGHDVEGRCLIEQLEQTGIETDFIAQIDEQPTTVKQRLLGLTQSRHPQQMIRIDRESQSLVDESTTSQLLAWCKTRLPHIDLVMISDYGKGVCQDSLLANLISMAREARVPVVVDPAPRSDFVRYQGCTCITPNRVEAAEALQRQIQTPDDGLAAAEALLAFGFEAALVTLDSDGAAWADRHGSRERFPVRPREVCDITGAGDMVAAAFSYALALGADSTTACRLANLAAGLEVERLGVVPLSRDELLAEIESDPSCLANAPVNTSPVKIVSIDTLRTELDSRRAAGQQIAMTNGCFDLLHPGHVASLQFARSQGDCLVVGLNSDASIHRLKGPDRPVLDEQARAAMLAALTCVDFVVVFDETSVESLVGQVLPDVLVKSAQYSVDEVVGHEIVECHGGRVVLCPMEGNLSTTQLVERIVQTHRCSIDENQQPNRAA